MLILGGLCVDVALMDAFLPHMVPVTWSCSHLEDLFIWKPGGSLYMLCN